VRTSQNMTLRLKAPMIATLIDSYKEHIKTIDIQDSESLIPDYQSLQM